MKTFHKLIFGDSRNLKEIPSESADLMITSPPYPMIEMWDEMFSEQNPGIEKALSEGKANRAFELMNRELDKAWEEAYRILKKGGIACINIGDATRTANKNFQLFSNHSRITSHCLKTGFQALPGILWRKQANTPNKFMGSGMLPPGAYVTLEHEHILVFRKGPKRKFSPDETPGRQASSYFWEERNEWFSDLWTNLKGASQKLSHEKLRDRSAAYPFELAYRLVNMFSLKEDTVLDPYLGTGTTTLAAAASGRNSIGVEIEQEFRKTIADRITGSEDLCNSRMRSRLKNHMEFAEEREKTKRALKHKNSHYGFPVMTRQETELLLNEVIRTRKKSKNSFETSYRETPQKEFCTETPEPAKTFYDDSERVQEKHYEKMQKTLVKTV